MVLVQYGCLSLVVDEEIPLCHTSFSVNEITKLDVRITTRVIQKESLVSWIIYSHIYINKSYN